MRGDPVDVLAEWRLLKLNTTHFFTKESVAT